MTERFFLQDIDRYNCEGCGRFISERQRFYDCPNCGARNAP